MVDQEKHVATEKARGGSTENVVRYVLGISLALAVIVMLLVLWM